MHMFARIKELGVKRSLLLARTRMGKKMMHGICVPLWLVFKIRYAKKDHASSPLEDLRTRKEDALRHVLEETPGGKFLEIGIGEFPRFDRFELIRAAGISYVGCDFAKVCDSHTRELAIKNTDMSRIQFRENTRGTYSWTLFEMLHSEERYDFIYIDGHHTFYIDLPAILLADRLLKPGGYLLLDDISWTLDFLKENMKRSLSQWYFYRTMYNFSDYTQDQQKLPHIQMIADELLLKDGRYIKDEALSLPHWWALRKER